MIFLNYLPKVAKSKICFELLFFVQVSQTFKIAAKISPNRRSSLCVVISPNIYLRFKVEKPEHAIGVHYEAKHLQKGVEETRNKSESAPDGGGNKKTFPGKNATKTKNERNVQIRRSLSDAILRISVFYASLCFTHCSAF